MRNDKMIVKPYVTAALTLGVVLCLDGCSTMRPMHEGLREGDIPEQFSVTVPGVASGTAWWITFGSHQLDRLMEAAFAGNLTLEQAAARLEQAEAAARRSGADGSVLLNVRAESASRRSWNNDEDTSEISHSVGLYASYELDLWGRVRSARRAAGAELEASRFDLQTVAMTLAAEMAQTYFDWLTQKKVLFVYARQLGLARSQLAALESRYGKGQTTSLAVLQQRQQVAAAEAKLPQVKAQIATLEYRMAVLLGRTPGSDLGLTPEALPGVSPRPEIGLPAEVLINRPDVQSARLALEAADWDVSAARASRFPAITLTGSLATSGEDVDQLFDDWIANLAAGLLGPLLDGGVRKAEVDRSQAVARERLAVYRLVVLEAVKEVEEALSNEQHQANYVEAIEKQHTAAMKTEAESLRRYQRGILPFVDTLSAVTSRESLDIARVQAQADLIASRIKLYRALGGDWLFILEEKEQ